MAKQELSSSSARQGICLSFNEAITTLPDYLQPCDEQERHELFMFLSQVDHLHKPVDGKISARSVFNFVESMLKPVTPTQSSLEVTIPKQLLELTENIAVEIVSRVDNDVDFHNTAISVLTVLQEVSWEAKVALMLTTFVLTFGDKGFNLCEKSKVSINDIQMFATLKGAFNKHPVEGSETFFTIVFKVIDSIVRFESLSTKYITSEDSKVVVERTHLIVTIYWIIRIIVGAATSYIIKLSKRGIGFDKKIIELGDLSSKWSKKMEDLSDKDYLNDMLSRLQDLFKEDVDTGAYLKIKKIVDEESHSDNMEVLNALISPAGDNMPPLYDCFRKIKVDLDDLKGERVLLFISGLENILPEVEESELNEFIDQFDHNSEHQLECKIVWVPIIDVDHSLQPTKGTKTPIMLTHFMNWCYMVHQKLYKMLEYDNIQKKDFKGWYFISDPSRISTEVKKLIRDDWKYKKGEPIIVVLDPQGNIVHHNAINMFYIWGYKAFPFTRQKEEDLWSKATASWTRKFIYFPIIFGMGELYQNWEHDGDGLFLYGGESIDWIKNFTGMVSEIERELGYPIRQVYVGRSHNKELVRSVDEESLSHCLSDQFLLWLFWKRIESFIYSYLHNDVKIDDYDIDDLQRLLNYDKSNVGWAFVIQTGLYNNIVYHGKVALSTLKEFQLSKYALSGPFHSHYKKVYEKILPSERLEFPTTALKDMAIHHDRKCHHCESRMEEYTSFECYHPSIHCYQANKPRQAEDT